MVPTQRTLLLPPQFLGSVAYYALINAFPAAVVDTSMRFDKRCKETHRCLVADTHGLKKLTVPIEKPLSLTAASWADIRISQHGAWWHVIWETLKSAYGRTPFFEFYADDFEPFFTRRMAGRGLCELNRELDALLRLRLGIATQVLYGAPVPTGEVVDCRRLRSFDTLVAEKPYYQVRALTQGFQPGLSAVDLLFNLGPEAALHLDALALDIKIRRPEVVGPTHDM